MSKKHNFAFLFALPALLIVCMLRLPVVLYGVILPFKAFSMFEGFSGSPWVGLDNFRVLLALEQHLFALVNTLSINVILLLLIILLSFVISLSLSKIKTTWVYRAICIFITIPLFIPQMYWIVLINKVFGINGWMNVSNVEPKLYLGDSEFVRWLYIVVEVIRWAGLLAAMISYSVRKAPRRKRLITAIKVEVSIVLISVAFILLTDFEMLHPLVNPLIYETMDTITLFSYRTVIMIGDISLSGSVWFIQFLYCFLVLTALFLIGRRFIKNSLFPNKEQELLELSSDQPIYSDRRWTKYAAALVYGIYSLMLIIIMLLMAYSVFDQVSHMSNDMFIPSSSVYIVLAFITSIIGIILSVLLAYPLTGPSTLSKKLYTILLLLFIAAGQFGFHEYFFIRSLGMINTHFPVIITGMFSPVSVIILGTYANHKTADISVGFGKYLYSILPAAVAVFIGSLLLIMDSYTSSYIYMSEPQLFSPTFQIAKSLSSISP